MPQEKYNNKVIANGETLIDLTQDTITPSELNLGVTAHDNTGAPIVGTQDLGSYKEELAANLRIMAVDAQSTEPWQSLLDKILMIRQGDLLHEYFNGLVDQPNPSFGFFLPNEQLVLRDMVGVDTFNLMGTMVFTVAPPDPNDITGLSVTSDTGSAWAISYNEETKVYTCTYSFTSTASKFDVLQALDSLHIAATDGIVQLTCYFTGYNSGDTFDCPGTAVISWQPNSWASMEAIYPKWSDLEGKTWAELEASGKPT